MVWRGAMSSNHGFHTELNTDHARGTQHDIFWCARESLAVRQDAGAVVRSEEEDAVAMAAEFARLRCDAEGSTCLTCRRIICLSVKRQRLWMSSMDMLVLHRWQDVGSSIRPLSIITCRPEELSTRIQSDTPVHGSRITNREMIPPATR